MVVPLGKLRAAVSLLRGDGVAVHDCVVTCVCRCIDYCVNVAVVLLVC
jgi:hypothetical protein